MYLVGGGATWTAGMHTHSVYIVALFLEVMRIEDSVSSQFQPLSKIQTEAVLYISGYVNISHDDTQFAFR